MPSEGEATETVDQTLSSGQSRLEASRRMIDHLEHRLSRGSRLLDGKIDLDDTHPSES